MTNTDINETLASAKHNTMGHTTGGNAEHGQANVPAKLTNAALDASADAAESKTQKQLDRAAARADKDTKRRKA